MTNFEYYGNNGRECRTAYLEKFKLKSIINQYAFLDWLGQKHESMRSETYTYDSRNECRSKNIFPYYSFIVGEDMWFSVSDEFSDLDKAFDFFDFLFEKFNHRLVRMYFNTVNHGTGVAMSREGGGNYLTWENDKEQKIVHDAIMKRVKMKDNSKDKMTNFEYYSNDEHYGKSNRPLLAFKALNDTDGMNPSSFMNAYLKWCDEEHKSEIRECEKASKEIMRYIVYFDTGSDNCSGWLDSSKYSIVTFGHFMCSALQFKTREEAIDSAEKRLRKIYDLIDGLPEHEAGYPYNCCDKYTKEDKEEDKKRYKYHIMKIDTLSIANHNVV